MTVEQNDKTPLMARINRLEGQVQGLKRMMEQERPCQEVLRQVSAVCVPPRNLWCAMMEFHLRHCITEKESPASGQEVLESFLTALSDF